MWCCDQKAEDNSQTETDYFTDSILILKLKTGQSTTAFKASGLAKGDYVKKVTSSDTGVVKVSAVKKDGIFKLTAGKKTGNASVTVTLASKKTVSFKVAVKKSTVKTTKITSTVKKLTLAKETTYTKLASSITVAPVTSQEKITYSSSDKKIVTVTSKGVVKGLRKGTATIIYSKRLKENNLAK